MTKHLRYLFAVLLVWICAVGGMAQTTVTDELTWSGLGLSATSNSYSQFISKKFSSAAEYAGNASSNSGKYIQLNNSSNRGIVTSVSGGTVKTITIAFNSQTTANRIVDVYGSDTAYTDASNLYKTTSQGTKLGSATCVKASPTVTIDVTGSYKYIGIRSKSGVLYIDKITVVWTTSGSDLTSTTTSFGDNSGKTFTFTEGALEGFTAPTATAKAGETDITSQLVYSSSDEEIVTVAQDGTLTFTNTKFGTATITAAIEKGTTYDASSDTYTVVNNERQKTATSLSFGNDKDNTTVSLTEGLLSDGSEFTGYTATESTGAAGTIAYAASGDGVATVDAATGAVTINKTTYGTTTITATFTPTDADTYAKSTAKYEITNVRDAVFYESFDNCAGKGGNDGAFNGTGIDGAKYDNNGWNGSNVNAANECLKLGSSSNKGSATTPSITLSTGRGTLSFKAAGWKDETNKNIELTISNGTLTYNGTTAKTITISDLPDAAWKDYDDIAISATGSFTITFATKDTKNRFFLDDVVVKQTKAKLDPQLTFAEATQTKQMENGGMVVPLQTVTKAEGLDADVTYSLDCESSIAEISGTEILVYKAATIVVTATSAETDTYKAGSASYTLNVVDSRTTDAEFKFDAESYEIEVCDADGEFDAASKLQNPNKLIITWTISPTSDNVLIDKEGKVIVLDRGIYTITATGSSSSYKETTATCQLIVKDRTLETQTVEFVAGVNKGTQTESGNADVMYINPVTVSSTNAAFAVSTTYRMYSGSKTIISTKVGKITKIEFEDETNSNNKVTDLAADKGNYSWSDDHHSVWTGSESEVTFSATRQARATNIIVTLELPVAKSFAFSQTASDNALENYDNANVTIDRSLTADGGWYTLCLPFALDADQVKTYFGDGAQLRTFDSMSGTTMNFKSATAMEAGMPYLVMPTQNFDGNNTTFECVQLKAAAPQTPEADGYAMCGTYNQKVLATDGTDLFLGGNNKFYKPSATGNTINGFRVYFQCPADKAGMPMTANIDGVETAIMRIDGELLTGTTDTRVYNLQGQCVGTTLNHLPSGIYVCGGKKVVVK